LSELILSLFGLFLPMFKLILLLSVSFLSLVDPVLVMSQFTRFRRRLCFSPFRYDVKASRSFRDQLPSFPSVPSFIDSKADVLQHFSLSDPEYRGFILSREQTLLLPDWQ
jgi:hypothetical protein